MKNELDITIVLDRSGSMESIRNDVIGGLNSFIDSQRTNDVPTRLTLNQFDDVFETVYEGRDVLSIPKFSRENFVPRGSTALHDAMGKSIFQTGERLAKLPEYLRPNRVMMVIVTDGQENSSQYFTRDRVREMIDHQQSKYSWVFMYIGANQDAITEGANYCISSNNALKFGTSTKGVQKTWDVLGRSAKLYGSNDDDNVQQIKAGNVTFFSDQDREEANS